MSILPFTAIAGLAISMFSVPVRVTDTHYITISGVDQQVTDGSRTIDAAVDMGGKRSLEPIFGGSVSDGDIGIWPAPGVDLYFPLDEWEPGDPRKQSFVIYLGVTYRVVAVADYANQAGCKTYLASRHVQQDGGV